MAETTIVFATAAPWPPAEFIDKKGNVEGFSIDYIKAIGKVAGFTPLFANDSRAALLNGLASGKYDAIIASSLQIKDRIGEVDLRKPYYKVRQVLLVRKGVRFNTDEALHSARLGALTETYGYALINEIKGMPPVSYTEIKSAVDDLIAKKLDALVCDFPVASYYSKTKLSSLLQITTFSREPKTSFYTIAVRKGNKEILELIDQGIATVRARGIDSELKMKWKWL